MRQISYQEDGIVAFRRYDEELYRDYFKLHNHENGYEILYFIQGSAKYRVEGSIYDIKPYNIAIAQGNEMHCIWHQMPFEPYERIVVTLDERFFREYDCQILKAVFTSRGLGENNIFTEEEVRRAGIPAIMDDITECMSNAAPLRHIIMRCKVIELLCRLNEALNQNDYSRRKNDKIGEIIYYINEHITDRMPLDELADKFYISKYHLCRMFKKRTGYTINNYIIRKRLMLANELYSSGKSLIDSCMEAGFESYSNFYKRYVNEYGKAPYNNLNSG